MRTVCVKAEIVCFVIRGKSVSLRIVQYATRNSINENEIITKKIDAKLIGADKGTITIEYTTPSECKITDCSSSFLASGDFNFNGGKFVYDGVEYTIVEIGPEAFDASACN